MIELNMTIYDFWVILIWGIVLMLVVLVIFPIYNAFRYSKGKGRRISGELIRDLGLALMVGAAFQFSVFILPFYLTILVGFLFIVWGTTMKEDKK